jgi:hypothetical protein
MARQPLPFSVQKIVEDSTIFRIQTIDPIASRGNARNRFTGQFSQLLQCPCAAA